jgi:hypothetical protein
LTSPPAVIAQERPLVVGHLRSDGLAIPFVQFMLDGPARASSRAVYLADTWRFQDWEGNESILENGNPVTLTDDWYDEWGTVTNFSPRTLNPYRRPVTRVGVIASDAVEMSGFDRIVYGSAWDGELSPVPAEFAWAFDSVAAAMQAREESDGTIVDPPNPIEMTKLFRSRQPLAGGVTLYYVEAIRDLGDCRGWSHFQSWIFEGPGGTKFFEPSFERTDCDFKGSSFPQPWMVIERGSETYVLLEVIGWESGERRLMKVDEQEQVLFDVVLPN